MRELLNELSNKIYESIESDLIGESIFDIKNTNGNKEDAPRACKSSSSVYILYSIYDEVLYVGETGKSIKTRCFLDGGGSHCKKTWFTDINYVVHFTKDDNVIFNEKERKFIEQALSIVLNPVHYG